MPTIFGSHPATPPSGMLTGVRFDALVFLNKRTNDGRLIANTGFETRELPLTFSSMSTTLHGELGRAEAVGIIDEVHIEDDGKVWGLGWLEDSPRARMTGVQIQRKVVRGNSVELSVKRVKMEWDPENSRILVDFVESQLAATTAVARPAMEGCYVELEDPEFDFGDLGELNEVVELTEAAAPSAMAEGMDVHLVGAGVPAGFSAFSVIEDDVDLEMTLTGDEPPAAWFTELDAEPYPIRVEASGEVHGYLAAWGTPHLGVPGTSLIPPHSQTDYAYFANGEVLCDDGTFVAVGRLTMGVGHADEDLDWRDATAYYDDTAAGWAHVAIGENSHGIWVHGYVAPEATPAMVATARACGLSGDWRRVGGRLELVGALSVNAPGFNIPRPTAFSNRGLQTALIGAGFVAPLPSATGVFSEQTAADLHVLAEEARARKAAAEAQAQGTALAEALAEREDPVDLDALEQALA